MTKTILKWAGNKSRVMKNIIEYFPEDFGDYVEPFAGACGSFINSNVCNSSHNVYLNDANSELINLFKLFQQDRKKIEKLANSWGKKKQDYLRIREWDKLDDWNKKDKWEKAARTVYLNKLCFNGLFRVNNKTGHFNVPYAAERKSDIIIKEEADAFYEAIKNVNFYSEDYKDFITHRKFKENSLFYFDPPYVDIKNPDKGFEGYLCNFNLSEQIELINLAENLCSQGHTVVISNSFCRTTQLLYRHHSTYKINVNRSIAAKKESRGKVEEIVVVLSNN